MCALYRRPYHWTYRTQIRHGGPHLPLGGYRTHFITIPQPLGLEEVKEWFWRAMQPKRCISEKGTPALVGTGQVRSSPRPHVSAQQ